MLNLFKYIINKLNKEECNSILNNLFSVFFIKNNPKSEISFESLQIQNFGKKIQKKKNNIK